MTIKNYKILSYFTFSFLLFSVFSIACYASTQEIISASNEIAILKEKVDTLENLNERILNSVYWTLGILSTIFLGLISVNLYFNITGNKREIENIKKDFTEGSKNSIAASETRVLTEISALNQKEFDNIKSDILVSTKNEITASGSTILEKISALNQKEFDNIKSDILSLVKNEILSSEAKTIEKINGVDKLRISDTDTYKRSLDNVKTKLDDISITVKELETDKYASKGLQGHIMGLIELLRMDIDRNTSYRIPERLIKIRDYLKDSSVRSYIVSDLNKELNKLDGKPEYKILVDEIRGNIKSFAD